MSGRGISHQEIVKNLLDTKAVDFAAIGKAFADLGPAIALSDEPEDRFCATMRIFIRLYRITTPGTPVEGLGELGAAAAEVRS